MYKTYKVNHFLWKNRSDISFFYVKSTKMPTTQVFTRAIQR